MEYISIQDYINHQDEDKQCLLNEIYKIIKKELPDAEETFSYQMPTFKVKKNIIHFAAQKNHIGIYLAPEAIEFFKVQLKPYKHSKGAFQLKLNDEVPKQLIIDMIHYNLENLI